MTREKIFWGWFIVAGAFCVLALNYGTRYAFGVFLPPLSLEYGWNPFFLSVAAGLNMLVYACANVFTGHLSDSIAPRWIVTIGALLLATCFFLLPFATNPFVFCFVYGIIGGLGAAGMGVVVCASSVGKWFIKKRGTATGIATMGIGVGTAIIVPLIGAMEVGIGWRNSFFFLGILVILVAVIPAQILLRTAYPEDVGLNPDGDKGKTNIGRMGNGKALLPSFAILREKQFIIISLSFSLTVMAVVTVFIHGISYAVSCGIEKRLAALAIGFLSIAGLVGQIFFGWVSDRLQHPRNASIVGIILMAMGMTMLLIARDTYTLIAFAIVFGFGYGSLAPMAPILIARIFGREKMGSIHGLVTLFLGIGGAIGPVIATLILQITKSYTAVWSLMIVAFICSALLMRLLKDENGIDTNGMLKVGQGNRKEESL